MTAPTIDIAALHALIAEPDDDDDGMTCRRCHIMVAVHSGMEPTSVCDACAQAVVAETLPALLDRLEAAENCSVESHCPACLGNVRITRERAEKAERENDDLDDMRAGRAARRGT